MTKDAAVAKLEENWKRAPYLSNWKHLKSGGEYTVTSHVLIEATLEPAVIYYKRYARLGKSGVALPLSFSTAGLCRSPRLNVRTENNGG